MGSSVRRFVVQFATDLDAYRSDSQYLQ